VTKIKLIISLFKVIPLLLAIVVESEEHFFFHTTVDILKEYMPF